jgi:NAD(P)-dependent dehydrogenase (short-subunit alcohol dehydrogenase family)
MSETPGGVANRVALVTGASKGIGLATAKLLVQGGARVVGVARDQETLAVAAAASGMHHIIAADLSQHDECKRVIEETLRTMGNLEILVCNHGIGVAHETSLHLQDPEAYHLSMRTNLDGPFYLTRYALPTMIQNRYGRCVYTSSTSAIHAEPNGVGYNTSKAGLCGLMKSVSQDGGMYNVTANAVLPGWVRTELSERSAAVEANNRGITVDEVWRERAALYPPQRVVEPVEVAEVIVFLASEKSRGVSGQSISVTLGSFW